MLKYLSEDKVQGGGIFISDLLIIDYQLDINKFWPR